MYKYQEMRSKRARNALNSALNIKYFVKIKGSFRRLEYTGMVNDIIQLQFHIKMF